MDGYEMTLNGNKFKITKSRIIEAFEQTTKTDWTNLPGPEPYHVIVFNGEEKPVKAVFRKIFGTNDFITLDAERALKNLNFEIKIYDTAAVYIMPIGSEDAVNHMNNTLLNKVDKQIILEKGVTINEDLYEENKINVWGLIPGPQNTKQWQRFKPHDIIIFVPSKYNLIVTEILETTKSKDLANTLWGIDKNGQTWELIFFIKILGIIEKDKRSFLNELGYSEKDQLMGNRKITDRFIPKYQSVENFLSLNLEAVVSPESFSDDIATQAVENVLPSRLSKEERLEHLKELAQKALQDRSRDYVEVNGKRIKRKTILVAFVKERDNNTCEACGFTFKKKDGENYVEVAHIKPLSEGGPDDPENMVALCPNCHKKLDKGDEKARNEVIEALRKNGVNV